MRQVTKHDRLRQIYWQDNWTRDDAVRELRKGKGLKVKIQKGKYRGSVGVIDPKYLEVTGSMVYISAQSYVIDIKGEKLRHGKTSTMHYTMVGQRYNVKERLRRAKTPDKPETISDRHGVELRPGDPVLVALMRSFVYGVLEMITPTAIVVKHSGKRTRIDYKDLGTKGLVKIDKDLASRFLMEKLASA